MASDKFGLADWRMIHLATIEGYVVLCHGSVHFSVWSIILYV